MREWAKSGPSLSRGLSKDFLPLAQIDQFSKRQHVRPPSTPFAHHLEDTVLAQHAQQMADGLSTGPATARKPEVLALEVRPGRNVASIVASKKMSRTGDQSDCADPLSFELQEGPAILPAPQNIESARPRADILTASSEGPFIAITGRKDECQKSEIFPNRLYGPPLNPFKSA